MASLFSGPALFWIVAGNVTQPLFDGFTLLHEERAAQAAYEQAAWTYRTTVIGAFQNVANSLRAIQNDADALKATRDFEKAAKISLDLSQQQMQTGHANILFLLLAEQTYEQARDSGRTGAGRPDQRYGGAVHGAGRRLEEPRWSACAGTEARCGDRTSRPGS